MDDEVTVKVLHLRDSNDESSGSVLALHPQITVVRGLDDRRRSWLVAAIADLPAGQVGATGELDAHGVRFPIDEASLALLGFAAARPTVIRAADLPGHDADVETDGIEQQRAATQVREVTGSLTTHRNALAKAMKARTIAEEEIAALERGEGAARHVVAGAAAARSRHQAELASARREREHHDETMVQAVLARDVAIDARQRAEDTLTRARERHRSAMAAASGAAAAIEEARSIAAEDPTEALTAARERLTHAEAAVAAVDPSGDASPVSRRLVALEARRAELHRVQEAIGPDQGAPMVAALARLEGASGEAQPIVAALALADTWRDLHQQLRALDVGVGAGETAAEERVALNRRLLLEAEADFNQPVLTPQQIAKVEAAHVAVLEAQDRTETRFGGGRARKKLDDLRDEERRVLERLGFSTYADYMMSSSSRGVGSANQTAMDAARNQLEAAEADLRSLPGAADRARRRSELIQRRDAVAPRVADLLGHPPTGPEAEDELRQLRERVAPDEAAAAQLSAALDEAGVALGAEPHDRSDLELLARSYLAEQQATTVRRTEVAEALVALDQTVDVLRSAQRSGATELPDMAELPPLAEPVTDADDAAQDVARREARWSELETARTEVADLETAIARHRSASDRISALETELAASGTAVEDAADAVAAAEHDVDLAGGPALDEAVGAVAETESALARARAREDELAQGDPSGGEGDELDGLLHAARGRLAEADAAVTEAAAAEQHAAAQLADANAAYRSATARVDARAAEAGEVDRSKLVDDVEWELMSRLAAVRSVGVAGSVPLVLDEPFAALHDDEVVRVLDKASRLAGAVQLVVISDRDAVTQWATIAGPERAALV